MLSTRMCVACRVMRPKSDLLRLAPDGCGAAAPDPGGKRPGRGAYICPNPACLALAGKKRAFERAFKTDTDHIRYDLLSGMIGAADG